MEGRLVIDTLGNEKYAVTEEHGDDLTEAIDLTVGNNSEYEDVDENDEEKTVGIREETVQKGSNSKSKRPASIKARKLVFTEEDLNKRRKTANSQERVRMKNMSDALDDLRECLPDDFKIYNRKMSKIRTLRVAINYIKALDRLLESSDVTTPEKTQQMSPFQIPYSPYMFPSLVSSCIPVHYPEVYVDPYGQFYHAQGQPFVAGSPLQVSGHGMYQNKYPYVHPGIQSPPNIVPESSNNVHSISSQNNNISTFNSNKQKHSPIYHHQRVKRQRTATITTPEQRNTHELNSSFISSTSDDTYEIPNNRGLPSGSSYFQIDGIYPLPEEDADREPSDEIQVSKLKDCRYGGTRK